MGGGGERRTTRERAVNWIEGGGEREIGGAHPAAAVAVAAAELK